MQMNITSEAITGTMVIALSIPIKSGNQDLALVTDGESSPERIASISDDFGALPECGQHSDGSSIPENRASSFHRGHYLNAGLAVTMALSAKQPC